MGINCFGEVDSFGYPSAEKFTQKYSMRMNQTGSEISRDSGRSVSDFGSSMTANSRNRHTVLTAELRQKKSSVICDVTQIFYNY